MLLGRPWPCAGILKDLWFFLFERITDDLAMAMDPEKGSISVLGRPVDDPRAPMSTIAFQETREELNGKSLRLPECSYSTLFLMVP